MKLDNKYLFVSFSITKWDGPCYVRQKLMSEFAKEHRVIYVNPRKQLRIIIKNIFNIKQWSLGIRKINNNLVLIESPWIFPKIYRFKHIDKVIDWLYHFFIKVVIALFGNDCVKLLYIWEPDFSSFRRYYPKYEYIYHPYDLFKKYTYVQQNNKREYSTFTQPNNRKEQLKDERDLVQNAFLFYSVTDLLCDYYYRNFNRRPKLLPNAVQHLYFENKNGPVKKIAQDIVSSFPNKNIAHCGSIIGSLNLDIVIDSAKKLKDYTFLFIGPIRYTNIEEYDAKLATLLSLSNVYHLGPFHVAILPYLLRQMDILMMIYSANKNSWTYYGSPSKLFEYMALGKPIISTPHPVLNMYEKYITIVKNTNQFVSAVKEVEGTYDAKLLNEMAEIATKNTWKERTTTILQDIENNIG